MFSILLRSAKIAVLGLSLLGAMTQVQAAPLEFDLKGLGMDVPKNYVGRDGLFVGNNFYQYGYKSKNWTFNDVKLKIDDVTGVGVIAGTMTNNYYGNIWNINTTLNGLVIRSGPEAAPIRQDYNAGAHNLGSKLSAMVPGTGVEWKSLSMTYSRGSFSNTLEGFAMPDMGHLNVAELFFHSNFGGASGLIFDAWYKSAETVTKWKWSKKQLDEPKWVKKYGRWVKVNYEWVKESYQAPKYVGDTKAYAMPSEVPLPAAFWLLAPALIGLTALRRKRKV